MAYMARWTAPAWAKPCLCGARLSRSTFKPRCFTRRPVHAGAVAAVPRRADAHGRRPVPALPGGRARPAEPPRCACHCGQGSEPSEGASLLCFANGRHVRAQDGGCANPGQVLLQRECDQQGRLQPPDALLDEAAKHERGGVAVKNVSLAACNTCISRSGRPFECKKCQQGGSCLRRWRAAGLPSLSCVQACRGGVFALPAASP